MHPNSNARPNRWIIIWLVVLTIALFISIAGNAALVQAANDPPVKVFEAHLDDAGAVGAVNTGTIVSSTEYTDVIVVNLQVSNNHPHTCVLIGSVGVDHNGAGLYTIALGLNPGLIPNSKREFEFTNNVDNDENFLEVTTMSTVINIIGFQDYTLMASKNGSGSADLEIDEATLSVLCFKKFIGV